MSDKMPIPDNPLHGFVEALSAADNAWKNWKRFHLEYSDLHALDSQFVKHDLESRVVGAKRVYDEKLRDLAESFDKAIPNEIWDGIR